MKVKKDAILRVEEILVTGEEAKALRYASTLRCLGDYRDTIRRAHSANTEPGARFYRSIGEDPQKIYREGVRSLRKLIEENHLG